MNIIRIGHKTIRSFLTRVLLGKESQSSMQHICAKANIVIMDCEKALDAAIKQENGWQDLAREALRDIRKAI